MDSRPMNADERRVSLLKVWIFSNMRTFPLVIDIILEVLRAVM
jgi:hypothetical protein